MQLVIDFYFSLYLVHMNFRITKAIESDSAVGSMECLLLHLFMICPVMLMVYALMMTTRKIALLVGVLHLDDEAVIEVMRQMEIVKSARKRIADVLASTVVTVGKPDRKRAMIALDSAKQGELAILQIIAQGWNA
eukprot:COSAG01_NODE_32551_length_579_cov_0.960417_1_plen_134_part_10